MYEHPEVIVFTVDGKEIASTLAPVPREGDRVLIESTLLGGHTYRVRPGGVLRTYADSETHVSMTSAAAGGVFRVEPRRVYVSLESDEPATPPAT